MSSYYSRLETPNVNRLASGLFFRFEQNEQLGQLRSIGTRDVLHDMKHDDFVVPEYRQTKEGNELYLPLLEVSVEVEAVGTIAWTKLTQTFTNRTISPVKEATYCFPLYDKSLVTSFTCSIGSDKVLKGIVKPKSEAKAEFKAAMARQRVAALLEEHTPEVFETSVGNIPAQATVKVEICYITELKADLSGDGILLTIPTSVAPRYGPTPSSFSSSILSTSLAVPPENGLQIQIQVSSPVAINKIESRTHPVTIEMGSHGYTTTRNIRDLAKNRESLEYDPKKARATLSDRSACLGKDFVLLIQSRGGTLLASQATQEPHPKLPNHSALMVSINLRDMYTPDVVSLKSASEIIFLADRSGSMQDKIEALKIAIGFFLKSLPNNCFFNICSFGSNHVLMWRESRPYNQQNLDEAISYVATNFNANMGGTELLSGLQNVVQERKPALNTQIIILTDGEVWDSANTFDFIKNTRATGGKQEIRFFALGIGDAVSHHLVEGIGRHGGGLAEVVSVDSAGHWKGRFIRMLEAALTPSTWKVEISLDDVPIRPNWKEQHCIQAPYHIPDFHAFSRSSVYFLFSQEVKTKNVKVKATATSGEIVTADLHLQSLGSSRTCVHLLAAKAVLNDLESGQSWMHAISQKNNDSAQEEVEELSKAEGEKIGVEWSLSSKWTSFVVVDNINLFEKTSRLYQAEKTELADLTRTRLGATNYPVPNQFALLERVSVLPYRNASRARGQDQSGAPPAPSIGLSRGFSEVANSIMTGTVGVDRNTSVKSVMTLPACNPSARASVEQVLGRAGERGGIDSVIEFPETIDEEEEQREVEIEALYQVRLARRRENEEKEERGDFVSLSEISGQQMTTFTTSAGPAVEELRAEHDRIKKERQRAVSSASYANLGIIRHDGLAQITTYAGHSQSLSRASVAATGSVPSSHAPTTQRLNPNAPTFTSTSFPGPKFGKGNGKGKGTAPETISSADEIIQNTDSASLEPRLSGRDNMRSVINIDESDEGSEGTQNNTTSGTAGKVPKFQQFFPRDRFSTSFQDSESGLFSGKKVGSSTPFSDLNDSVARDSSFDGSGEDVRLGKNADSTKTFANACSELERQLITSEITLEALIDAQTAEGSFKLDHELATALKNKFKHWRFDLLVSALGEEILYKDMDKILQTARVIVLIETQYPDSCELWRLAIQKARAFVAAVIPSRRLLFPDTRLWQSLFGVLHHQLLQHRMVILLDLRDRDPWLRGNRKAFDRMFHTNLLEKPGELVQLLRGYSLRNRIATRPKRLIWILHDMIKDQMKVDMPVDTEKRGKNPDRWTDGWDDFLRVSKAVRLVFGDERWAAKK